MRSRLLLLSLVTAAGLTAAPRAASAQRIVVCRDCVHRDYTYSRYDIEDRIARQREQAIERSIERAERSRELARERSERSDRAREARERARERADRARERARDREQDRLDARRLYSPIVIRRRW